MTLEFSSNTLVIRPLQRMLSIHCKHREERRINNEERVFKAADGGGGGGVKKPTKEQATDKSEPFEQGGCQLLQKERFIAVEP